jgi:hypothetical protein
MNAPLLSNKQIREQQKEAEIELETADIEAEMTDLAGPKIVPSKRLNKADHQRSVSLAGVTSEVSQPENEQRDA